MEFSTDNPPSVKTLNFTKKNKNPQNCSKLSKTQTKSILYLPLELPNILLPSKCFHFCYNRNFVHTNAINTAAENLWNSLQMSRNIIVVTKSALNVRMLPKMMAWMREDVPNDSNVRVAPYRLNQFIIPLRWNENIDLIDHLTVTLQCLLSQHPNNYRKTIEISSLLSIDPPCMRRYRRSREVKTLST